MCVILGVGPASEPTSPASAVRVTGVMRSFSHYLYMSVILYTGPASEPTTPAGAVSVPGARRTLPPFNEAAGAAAVVSDEPFPNDSGYDL